MASVNFLNEAKTFDVLPGTKLRDVALQSGIQLDGPLHRVFHVNVEIGPFRLFSASDVVEVEGKGVNTRSEEEGRALAGRFLRRFKVTPDLRLASQIVVTGDVAVRTRVQREIDRKETREQAGYLALISGFTVTMLLMLALVGLDLVKKM